MFDSKKKYVIVNQNSSVPCHNRMAFCGDVFSEDEVLRPDLIESLLKVGKIEEADKEQQKAGKQQQTDAEKAKAENAKAAEEAKIAAKKKAEDEAAKSQEQSEKGLLSDLVASVKEVEKAESFADLKTACEAFTARYSGIDYSKLSKKAEKAYKSCQKKVDEILSKKKKEEEKASKKD